MEGRVGPLPINVQRGLIPSLQPLSLAGASPDLCGCKGPRFPASLLQGFCQEAAAADRHEGHPEELRCLPEAEKLAVVETLHQSKWPVPGESAPSGPWKRDWVRWWAAFLSALRSWQAETRKCQACFCWARQAEPQTGWEQAAP